MLLVSTGGKLTPTRGSFDSNTGNNMRNRGYVVAAAGRGLYIPPGAPSGERSDCGQIIPPDFIGRSILLTAARRILRPGWRESWLPISRIHLSRQPRAGRYNSLDLASKVVRQRRARPSLGTFPDADSAMFIAREHGRCRHLFSCKCMSLTYFPVSTLA